MRRHPIGGIYSWYYFPCTSDLPIFKNFFFFFFLSFSPPALLPLPPSLLLLFSLSLLFFSFFDKRKQSSKYLASFLWLHLSGGGCLRPDHSILLSDCGLALCCRHQTCKEHSFWKHPGKCGSGCFRETSGTFLLKEVCLPEIMVLKIGIIPSWLTLFQTLPGLYEDGIG